MPYANADSLVSTEWLFRHLVAPDVHVVDASYMLPTMARDARAEYMTEHIPGAVFFDIDAICAPDTDLPHMMPDPDLFADEVAALGLGDGVRVVVYDSHGGYLAAARVWWMFRAFGHDDVCILEGGLPKWKRAGLPVTDYVPIRRRLPFTCYPRERMVRSFEDILANVESRAEQVVDARSAGRFVGTEPEPRATAKSGRIPGSFNVPFNNLIDADRDFRFKPADDLRRAFTDAGVDLEKPIVTTCGSGATACVLSLALHLIGIDDTPIYDGSWAEWGNRDDAPVETG